MNKGLEIKLMRIKANIKAINLAKKLNMSPSKLSLIENGHIKCSEEEYKKAVVILEAEF
ncbi:Helix-turn-helix [Proteiniborus ethanoligenes]|uniref:Helix-turn-helix n=1 Tax=Proteiniborus ethanoligenes TaxID=415015 RepID=A0A1H3SQ40_9FIRM|nr:helix-turn-helix transcriptional regulator [Proteiniborus ethanoligenes]SDZ40044.1 Helix-turn-helix [Proteiniborus ethanoligenes]